MIRRFLAFAALAFAAAPALSQTIVTSPVELVDNSPTIPGIRIETAKTTPQVKKGTSVYPCEGGGPPWRYSVGAPCPAPVAEVDPYAIAAPVITSACRPLVSSAGTPTQWTYFSAGGTLRDACFTRALDLIPLGLTATLDAPRLIEDVQATNVRHILTQQTSSKVSWRPFANIEMRRTSGTCSKRCVFIRGGSTNVTIEDVDFGGIGINTSVGDIPVGVGIQGGDVTIRRAFVHDFRSDYPAGKYDNADCISAERGDKLRVYFSRVARCTDGGIDTKADTILDNVIAEDIGHYSYRAWAHGEAGTLTSINAGGAAVQIASKTTDWHIRKLIVVGSSPVVRIDGNGRGGRLVIDECDLSKWTGKTVVSGTGATVTLGTGCRI